jgi:CspA family cold shock protein
MQGIIKFFNLEKGFGFVSPSNGGQDAFVHIVQLPVIGVDKRGRKIYRIPREGERVSFELIMNDRKKTEAANIAFIDFAQNGDEGDDMTEDDEI